MPAYFMRTRTRILYWTIISLGVMTAGCVRELGTTLEQLSAARRVAADLQVQFTQASDATNLAVMADTDQQSASYARDAESRVQAVQKDIGALRPILSGLGYSNESRILDEFEKRFAEYRALDRRISDLAVQSTNLKAQRLSFGPAREAAASFSKAVQAAAESVNTSDNWHARALAAEALAAVREMQAIEAPHIAEADDDAMTQLETQMAGSAETAKRALDALTALTPAAARPQIAAASAALKQFVDLNAQITELSRRNSNVHSLALSLGQKRKLTAACEDSLRELRESLDAREFSATR